MSGDRSTVLIVDDSIFNRFALTKILEQDYELLAASNGMDALKIIEEKQPDLVLMDIVMPGMSGLEALAKMKENSQMQHIPVIVISGMDHEQDEEKGFLSGAVDYITKPFRNVSVKVRVNTHIQIAKQIKINERLGLIDPLTELPNRRSFDRRMLMEWRRAIRDDQALSFFMMDLDRFKRYNDHYGHLQGDELLKKLARIAESTVRRAGDFIARIGGEEFAVILPNTDNPGANIVGENIRQAVENARIQTIDGTSDICMTISIGIATTRPEINSEMDELIAAADKNLYEAKENGRNRIVSSMIS